MDLGRFFHEEVKPALGCTEPGAVAYAAATAARLLPGKAQRLDMDLSLGMFKNGRDVKTIAKYMSFSSVLILSMFSSFFWRNFH